MRAEYAATTTAIACGAEHVPSCRPVCHLLVLFLWKQTVPRRSGCKGVVGIVASLRPAEIWGEDEVSLKRRCITAGHVAHVTGSVWQRLLGARVHDMTRCQLDAEACVGGRLQQLPCDERALVRGACVVLHMSIVSKMQTKASSDAVFPHQHVARCLCFIVACGDYTSCADCLQLRHGVFILKQSSTQCATRC